MSNNMPILSLLQQLKEGLVEPKSIDKDTRRQLAEVLYSESYTIYQIAQVFKCSEKTIQRDLNDIRRKNALTPSVDFAKEIIGEMLSRARQHCSSLARLSKNPNASTQEKILAEISGWKVFKDLIERFQSLGYLPLKPQQVSGDIYHHMLNEEGGESLDEVKKMLTEIESVAKEAGTYTPELNEDLKLLSGRIEKSEVATEVKKLKKEQEKQITKKEDQSEET